MAFPPLENKDIIYIVIAAVIVLLIFFVGIPFFFSELKELKRTEAEEINRTKSRKYIVPVTKGICSVIKENRVVINTYNKRNSEYYVDLVPSINFSGGAQYSYSFWLKKDPGTNEKLKNRILFFRGSEIKCSSSEEEPLCPDGKYSTKGFIYDKDGNSPKEYKDYQVDVQTNDDTEYNDAVFARSMHRFTKAPLVRFGDFVDSELVVEFNTLRNPHQKVVLNGEVFSLLKSSKKHPTYNLITISFQDNFDFGGSERGIKVEVFINDALVKIEVFENNAIRLNKGPIVLFPRNDNRAGYKKDTDAQIVDLTYYNFALNSTDVDKIYNSGFTNRTCEFPDSNNSDKMKFDYGRLNLYNETRQLD